MHHIASGERYHGAAQASYETKSRDYVDKEEDKNIGPIYKLEKLYY